MPFWIPWTIYYKMHILFFFKEVLIILKYSTKYANIWLGVQYPHKDYLTQ